jgi:hypothetical protein
MKIFKLFSLLVAMIVSSVVHALPAGVDGAVALTSSSAAPNYSLTSTSVCASTTVAPSFSAGVTKKANGKWYMVWNNQHTNGDGWTGTEMSGFAKVTYTVTGSTTATSFSTSDPVKIYHDIAVANQGGDGLVTYSYEGLSSTGITNTFTASKSSVSMRPGSVALETTNGFKTTGATTINVTISCIN